MEKWTKEQINDIYNSPLFELIHRAAEVHRNNFSVGEVQVCTLLSIKTGACSEDCSYCPQSARASSEIEIEKLKDTAAVLEAASAARSAGSTRFCMGAAWREVKDNSDFDRVLDMIRGVRALGLEVCCTLGMLTDEQTMRLKEAGLTAYNHNIDTSRKHYSKIVSTRSYDDRLDTLKRVGDANISICSGGILGLGESHEDRVEMLYTLNSLSVQPESIPVNAIVPVKGTPLEESERVSVWDMVRMIATARIVFPQAKVRLSAGRSEMSRTEQALCFLAGANSIFSGDKLLTTPNGSVHEDAALFDLLGLTPQKANLN